MIDPYMITQNPSCRNYPAAFFLLKTKTTRNEHKTYLHLIGKSQVRSLEIGILEVIDTIDIDIFHGSTISLRRRIIEGLRTKGWSSEIKVSANSNISITAINGKTALCLQTGNMGRFYADLLKLQFLYQKRKVEFGHLCFAKTVVWRERWEVILQISRGSLRN